MRRIFTLVSILVSSFGLFSQSFYALEKKSTDTFLIKMLQGRLGCGIDTAQRPKVESQRIIFRCGRARTYTVPLLIVDGISKEMATLQTINPDEIVSFHVLKEAAAIALYGSRASSGIILITTKSSQFREFSIKDSLDGSKIAGATVTFSSANDKLVFVADKNGLVKTALLKAEEQYDVNVSAVGYWDYSLQFKNSKARSQELLLKRDVKTCSAVVIVSNGTVRCRCCRRTICSWSKKAKTFDAPVVRKIILQ
jgi:TonB-dependent SusC/RagA subfamily outer membrane receptor